VVFLVGGENDNYLRSKSIVYSYQKAQATRSTDNIESKTIKRTREYVKLTRITNQVALNRLVLIRYLIY